MVYLFLANGFEIIEALAPVDMLRRANINVQTVGIGSKNIESSCNIKVEADISETEIDLSKIEAVILPGGMPGAKNLELSDTVQKVIDYSVKNNVLICAICAAPYILGKKNLLNGKKATCFPGFESDLKNAILSDLSVVRDGNFITAKGAGVSVDFGLEIVKALKGECIANEIRSKIQCK